MSDIKRALLDVLPTLSETLLSAVADHLSDCGVEEESDLQFVEENDLKELLKPIQCRKLLRSWKVKGLYNFV